VLYSKFVASFEPTLQNAPENFMKYRNLNPALIVQTINQLRDRVEERFPGAGLAKVAAELQQIGEQAVQRSDWIARPHIPLRIGIIGLLGLMLLVGATAVINVDLPARLQTFAELVQVSESGINTLVFFGAGVAFLFTIESRIKRKRALDAIHELRSLAHIIDMHQLTKDPDSLRGGGPSTKSSPKRTMTNFELSRYLDYCSEMLSLIGKIAALYVQHFNDPVVLSAVDQIEDLTTSLSRKVWQKIMILNENAE
jgi:hypothetical protein